MDPRAEGAELPIDSEERIAVMPRLRIQQPVEGIGVCLAQLARHQNRLQSNGQHAKAILERLIDQAARPNPQLAAAPFEAGLPEGGLGKPHFLGSHNRLAARRRQGR